MTVNEAATEDMLQLRRQSTKPDEPGAKEIVGDQLVRHCYTQRGLTSSNKILKPVMTLGLDQSGMGPG